MTTLDEDTLAIIMMGTTHSLDMGSAQATVRYGQDFSAQMQLPDGTRRAGHWRLLPDGYEVDWENGPSARWRLTYENGKIEYVDPSGTPRARLAHIAFDAA